MNFSLPKIRRLFIIHSLAYSYWPGRPVIATCFGRLDKL